MLITYVLIVQGARCALCTHMVTFAGALTSLVAALEGVERSFQEVARQHVIEAGLSNSSSYELGVTSLLFTPLRDEKDVVSCPEGPMHQDLLDPTETACLFVLAPQSAARVSRLQIEEPCVPAGQNATLIEALDIFFKV
jgi:hypothetical protein